MDELQFSTLIDQHQAMIWRVCRLYCNHAEDREDLFQEIAIKLWQSQASFRGDAKFTTWMYRIALNTAITSLRRRRPAVSYPGEVPDVAAELPDEEAAERYEKLSSAIRLLDDTEKALITLYLEGMSYAEIAEALGITENYTGVKLSRIKDKLKTMVNR
ncbi:DNA-directed RNA polymerase sigma-70 factor [Parapedobacter pyrenivorans]|uniref:DNA-directed RNA polymerase sigma-70 factor n=1 Tax=Parapedobacter pyrenivorans TaxID=1305674 RepID=A0A917I0P2_9SPHI|nr:sigma-70 family RNA polymerase sigma factor [Parapedobacter pyrenivorans]GGH02139.1 DNA-directed RNA polymerase sigma-70 factor [Parapedobacter pyrenivorans]